MRSVEIFASSWNMGGVDRESCTLSPPTGKSALQLVIPYWIPKGYDLYVRARVLCICTYV